MNDETKILFDAPWTGGMRKDRLSEEYVVVSDHNFTIAAHVDTKENANRLSRLPELYDALMEALEIICGIPGEDACDHCSNASLDLGGPCRIREWRELLQKVRDGE